MVILGEFLVFQASYLPYCSICCVSHCFPTDLPVIYTQNMMLSPTMWGPCVQLVNIPTITLWFMVGKQPCLDIVRQGYKPIYNQGWPNIVRTITMFSRKTHCSNGHVQQLCNKFPQGKSHQIPLNHHFPMVFLQLSHFPMDFSMVSIHFHPPMARSKPFFKHVHLKQLVIYEDTTPHTHICIYIYMHIYIYVHVYI